MAAIEPSPTAEPTRLIDSARASPAANIPGLLVSRGKGHGSASSQSR
jgi:hypothetical protein